MIIRLLLTSALLIPLYPLNIPPLIAALILGLRSRNLSQKVKWGLLGLLALSVAVPIVGRCDLIAILILAFSLALFVKSRQKLLANLWVLGYCIGIGLSLYVVSMECCSIVEFADFLKIWCLRGSPWYIALYLVIMLTAVGYVLGLASKSKHISENPGVTPVVMFMVMLVLAAVLLALGNERGANRLAELAYYFLVIGVALQLYSVARSRD